MAQFVKLNVYSQVTKFDGTINYYVYEKAGEVAYVNVDDISTVSVLGKTAIVNVNGDSMTYRVDAEEIMPVIERLGIIDPKSDARSLLYGKKEQ